ncbi:MAG: caspase family protein [Thiovulaceae bacterium]|nr:caspase family protein [Sulfurimonadaceae bacterium]
MNKVVLIIFLLPFLLFAQMENPYKNLSDSDKVAALTHYFVKKQMQVAKPGPFRKGEFETTAMFEQRIAKAVETYKIEVARKKRSISKLTERAMGKAMGIVYGKPRLGELNYNADEGYFFTTLNSTKGSFSQKIVVNVPVSKARNFKANKKYLEPIVTYSLKGSKLLLSKVHVKLGKKSYLAQLTNQEHKSQEMKVAVADLADYSASLSLSKMDVSIDRDALARQSSNIAFDDLPQLLDGVKQAKSDNRKWLFIIGIENYDNTDNVTFAKKSARTFEKVMKKKLGIPNHHIYSLIDSKATSGSIKGKLKLMLRNVAKGDTIYFYYNGHGIPVMPSKEPYILPKDMIPEYVQDESFFKLENIYKMLSSSKAGKVVAVIDSCFSGATDNKSIIKGVAATRLKPKSIRFDKSKMVILAAGRDKQYSNMYEKRGHRLFSYFFMKSLLEGETHVNKIYSKIFQEVKEESLKMGDLKLQEPTAEGNKGMML